MEPETFTFSNGKTVMVYQDNETESPLLWGLDVDAYTYRAGYHLMSPGDGDDDVLMNAFLEYVYRDGGKTDPEELLTRAERYSRVFFGDTRIAVLKHFTGYAQSDWAEIVFIGEDLNTIEMAASAYAYYFRGDVYTVIHVGGYEHCGGMFADSAEEAANFFAADMGWEE